MTGLTTNRQVAGKSQARGELIIADWRVFNDMPKAVEMMIRIVTIFRRHRLRFGALVGPARRTSMDRCFHGFQKKE